MIKAYSNELKLPPSVFNNGKIEAQFRAYFVCSEADEVDEHIIKEIDNAIIVDRQLGQLKTPYGLIDRMLLSRGCKTALVSNWIKKNNKVKSQ